MGSRTLTLVPRVNRLHLETIVEKNEGGSSSEKDANGWGENKERDQNAKRFLIMKFNGKKKPPRKGEKGGVWGRWGDEETWSGKGLLEVKKTKKVRRQKDRKRRKAGEKG